ncbi:hypothetical protein Tco_0760976 [Tanacetum coccineum]
MAENVIAEGTENRPSMLDKGMYDSWKTHIWLYIKRKENGEMSINSIVNGPFKLKEEITILGLLATSSGLQGDDVRMICDGDNIVADLMKP